MSKDNTVITTNQEWTNSEGSITNKSLTKMGKELQERAENLHLHLLFQTLNTNTENVSDTIILADNTPTEVISTEVISSLQNGNTMKLDLVSNFVTITDFAPTISEDNNHMKLDLVSNFVTITNSVPTTSSEDNNQLLMIGENPEDHPTE